MTASRQNVFISGAAAGIGLATAQRFASAGWRVGVYDIDEAAAGAAARKLGGDALAGRLDVADPTSWDAALAAFTAITGGKLDVLVNNAGIMTTGPFETIPLATQLRIVDVNAKGVLAGCHAAFTYLRATPGARLVNLCSASAIYGQPDMATYSATKFFVRGLTEALEIEWRPFGIKVLAIWPLYVNTALVTDNPSTPAMGALGVRLTANDVADVVFRAATSKRGRRAHWPVGLQTRMTMLGSHFGPPAVTRFVVAKLSRR